MATIESVLITGGGGYVGSAVAYTLAAAGYRVIAIDTRSYHDLSSHATSYHSRSPSDTSPSDISLHTKQETTRPEHVLPVVPVVPVLPIDYGDQAAVYRLCTTYQVTLVIHLAASIEVGASVIAPADYYSNNGAKLIPFLAALRNAGVTAIIAASSSAVYGIPEQDYLDEHHPTVPLSPYGRSKLLLEWILEDYARAYGIRAVALRYANIAGALPRQNIGEQHSPETHLIPRALNALDSKAPLTIYGTDYPTADGTCLRDFVHLADVVSAHQQAIRYLDHERSAHLLTCNIGSGRPTSVQTLISTLEQYHNRPIPIQYGPRRPGDPATIVLSIERAKAQLGWTPQQSDIATILRDASEFYFNNKNNDSL